MMGCEELPLPLPFIKDTKLKILLVAISAFNQFFGRGGIAGVDIKIQKKNQGAFYGEMLDKRRTDVEKDQEKERLRKLQEKQDKQRFNDRHWSDKELASMTQVCPPTHCFHLASVYYKKDSLICLLGKSNTYPS